MFKGALSKVRWRGRTRVVGVPTSLSSPYVFVGPSFFLTTEEPLNGFSLNFIAGILTNIGIFGFWLKSVNSDRLLEDLHAFPRAFGG
jgi:hypothetical protein